MTRVSIGLDPGPSSTGWAILRTPGGVAQPRFIDGGKVDSNAKEIRWLLAQCYARTADCPPIVAIETPAGYIHEHARGSALLATAKIAGLIDGIAQSMGLRTVAMPATTWRRSLCGRHTASDAVIKRALQVVVAGLPKRTNVHVRDALGCAFAALQVKAEAA